MVEGLKPDVDEVANHMVKFAMAQYDNKAKAQRAAKEFPAAVVDYIYRNERDFVRQLRQGRLLVIPVNLRG